MIEEVWLRDRHRSFRNLKQLIDLYITQHLPKDSYLFLDKNDERQCRFFLFLLFSDKDLEVNPRAKRWKLNNSYKQFEKVILDSKFNIEFKEEALNRYGEIWSKLITKQKHFNWIDRKNTEQIRWCFEYLLDRELVPPYSHFRNNLEMYYSIVLTLDIAFAKTHNLLGKRFNSISRTTEYNQNNKYTNLIDRIKNTWVVKNKRQRKIEKSFTLSKTYSEKLQSLCDIKNQGSKQIIYSLIDQELKNN